LDLGGLPDSPYAQELRGGAPRSRFGPRLESEFVRARLVQNRTVIRVACVFATVLSLLRGAEQIYGGTWNLVLLIDLAFIIGSSAALAYLAWSNEYLERYMPWARIVVPLRNMIVAAHVTAAAAHGQPEMLMVLPIALFGPFFFQGLRLRAAVLCSALTLASYAVSATHFHLPQPIALRADALLFVGAIAYIVTARNVESSARLEFLERHLIAELAQRDGLTGAKNRRVFDEHLQQLWQRAVTRGRTLAILLIDIDYFKAYNDRYGHQAGDEALRRVAEAIQKFAPLPSGLVARYGGEEFAVVLYNVDMKQAREVADRIRHAVDQLAIEHRGSKAASRVTVSIGVAAVEPSWDRSPRGAVQLADQALYEAKVRGRNRVETMGEEQHRLLVTGVFAIDTRTLVSR
jgi:diguanylate cyclase (GGDEF)-like protein